MTGPAGGEVALLADAEPDPLSVRAFTRGARPPGGAGRP